MVRSFLNLLNIDHNLPGVRQLLENGSLSKRRNEQTLARAPVDLTHEKTIKADAASRLAVIAASLRTCQHKDDGRRLGQCVGQLLLGTCSIWQK